MVQVIGGLELFLPILTQFLIPAQSYNQLIILHRTYYQVLKRFIYFMGAQDLSAMRSILATREMNHKARNIFGRLIRMLIFFGLRKFPPRSSTLQMVLKPAD